MVTWSRAWSWRLSAGGRAEHRAGPGGPIPGRWTWTGRQGPSANCGSQSANILAEQEEVKMVGRKHQ